MLVLAEGNAPAVDVASLGVSAGASVLHACTLSPTASASIAQEGGPSNSLPWVLGANPEAGGWQFGVLFNSPTLGGVGFNSTGMRWYMEGDTDKAALRQQFDFLVTTHAADCGRDRDRL